MSILTKMVESELSKLSETERELLKDKLKSKKSVTMSELSKIIEEEYESYITEARYNKKKLMKTMKKDDGFIHLRNGKQLVIYNPNNNNKDNADMWQDDVIFALDQDGGEHEVKYSDIVRYTESQLDEKGKGLWHNIRAKRARGEKPARKGSKAYKKAKKAADDINASEGINESSVKDLQTAKKGAKATGGGYGPFIKIGSDSWKNPKTGRLMHSQALSSHIGGFNDFIVEVKKKGADGKACWKGYRYAGTENGKDKCVKIGEGELNERTAKATLEDAVKALMKTFAGKKLDQRYVKDYLKSIEKIARKKPGQFVKDYGDFKVKDWIEDVEYNLQNEAKLEKEKFTEPEQMKMYEIKKGDYVDYMDEIGLVNKVSGRIAYVKFDSQPKSFHPILKDLLKKSGKKHKGKDLYTEGKVTAGKVSKAFNKVAELIKLLKANLEKYKSAEGKDKDKYKKIALDLTKKKKAAEEEANKLLTMLDKDVELVMSEGVNPKKAAKVIFDKLVFAKLIGQQNRRRAEGIIEFQLRAMNFSEGINEATNLWKHFDAKMKLQDTIMDLEYDMKMITKDIAQLHKDMEQEAEPAGGKIADKYGREIDKKEKEYKKKKAEFKKLMAKLDRLEQY